jgi:integrase
MVLFAGLTGANIAEICGLCWKHVNLTDQPIVCFDSVARSDWQETIIPALSIGIRRQWIRGEYGSTKTKDRDRNLPIPARLLVELQAMRQRPRYTGPDDPVFASESGRPIDEHSRMRNFIKPAACLSGLGEMKSKDGRPLKGTAKSWVSWHCFRRTFATLTDAAGLTSGGRMSLMGHSSAEMTARYSRNTAAGLREALDGLAERLFEETKGTVN